MLLIPVLLTTACNNEEKIASSTCDLTDPIEQLPWLKEVKNSLNNCACEMSIVQAEFESRTVFFVAMTDPLCNGVQTIVLYNCDGELVKTFSNDEYLASADKLNNRKNLYRCKTENSKLPLEGVILHQFLH